MSADTVSDTVKALVGTNREMWTILDEIVLTDEQFAEDDFGWQYADIVSWSGSHVKILLEAGLIKHGYKSNKHTHFRLAVDRDEVRRVLNDLEPLLAADQAGGKGCYAVQQDLVVERQEEAVTVTEEQVAEWETLLAVEADMVEYWAACINPKIEGLLHVKKAALLCIASGNDHHGDRGRIHLLMHGAPGSAKTQVARWIALKLGGHFCSQRTSRVGLTGSGAGGAIVPGALPRAHNSILSIDELDKFENRDRQSALEAMEDGIVHIEVGGNSATFPAECRIIACANRIDHFSPELLDRFDFRFDMATPTTTDKKRIMAAIIESWGQGKGDYDGQELRAYLKWIRSYEPDFAADVRKRATALTQLYIDLTDNEQRGVRSYESIIRVGLTRAKVNRRPATAEDFYQAIRMLDPSLNGGKLEALARVAGLEPHH